MVDSGHLKTEALTTAFFCQYFNNWFDAMNARRISEALFANATQKPEFLKEVFSLVFSLCHIIYDHQHFTGNEVC